MNYHLAKITSCDTGGRIGNVIVSCAADAKPIAVTLRGKRALAYWRGELFARACTALGYAASFVESWRNPGESYGRALRRFKRDYNLQ